MPDETIQPQEIVFPNNNGAKHVAVAWRTDGRPVPIESLPDSKTKEQKQER